MYEVFGTECVYVPSQRAEGNHFKTVFCFVSSVPEVWIKRGGGIKVERCSFEKGETEGGRESWEERRHRLIIFVLYFFRSTLFLISSSRAFPTHYYSVYSSNLHEDS